MSNDMNLFKFLVKLLFSQKESSFSDSERLPKLHNVMESDSQLHPTLNPVKFDCKHKLESSVYIYSAGFRPAHPFCPTVSIMSDNCFWGGKFFQRGLQGDLIDLLAKEIPTKKL